MRKIPRFFCQIQPQKNFYFHRGLIRSLYGVTRCGPPLPLLTLLSTQIVWSINRGFRQRMLSSWLSNCSTEQFTIYIAFNGTGSVLLCCWRRETCWRSIYLYSVWRYKTEFINYADSHVTVINSVWLPHGKYLGQEWDSRAASHSNYFSKLCKYI